MNVVLPQKRFSLLRKSGPWLFCCCTGSGNVRDILAKSPLLEHMQCKPHSILCCRPLTCALVLSFVAIGPVADSLDENPIHFPALCSRVETRAFHLSTNGFRGKF